MLIDSKALSLLLIPLEDFECLKFVFLLCATNKCTKHSEYFLLVKPIERSQFLDIGKKGLTRLGMKSSPSNGHISVHFVSSDGVSISALWRHPDRATRHVPEQVKAYFPRKTSSFQTNEREERLHIWNQQIAIKQHLTVENTRLPSNCIVHFRVGQLEMFHELQASLKIELRLWIRRNNETRVGKLSRKWFLQGIHFKKL